MTKDEQPVEQLDAEIRAIEAADPTETSGAALLRGAKEEIERLQRELADNKFLLKGSRETFDKQRKRIEKAERELAEAQAETWKADGEAERKLAESKEEARELRQINAQAIKGRIACSDLLAEARAEVAAWERKFGGRTDFNEALDAPAPEECPHGCRGTGWIGAGNSWGDTAALPCPLHEPIPKSGAERLIEPGAITKEYEKIKAEQRVVKAAREVWQRYQTIIRLRPTFDSPFWKEFGAACEALAAQQEPTPDEESGDAG